jgi:catechol 2,3-dioxygenase-like lactoylglutathione lyase family enzyme
VLFVRDLKRLAAFYQAACELEPLRQGDDHVVLGRPGFELVVHQIPARFLAGERAGPPVRREWGTLKLCFPVGDLARTRAVVDAAGGVLDGDETAWLYEGERVGMGHDPEGNVFQVRAAADRGDAGGA